MPKFLRRRPRSVRDVLEGLGMPAAEIDDAELAGTAELLAIDGVVLPGPGKLTVEELAKKVGTEVEVVQAFWRALGFVDPVEGERLFTRRDVVILKDLVSLTDDGLVDPEVSLQVARVVGMSMAQVATAVVDATEARSKERSEHGAPGDDSLGTLDDAGSLAVRAGELLPFISDVIDYSFRRHLRAAARRRVVVTSSVGEAREVIGFADLVRFTELSQNLDDHELAELVWPFGQIVNRVVVRHGGRIVKMIGDAAMFSVVEPMDAARVALELSDSVATDDRLSALRIGMACGPVLALDGDLYGPVVNLASRLVEIGNAGAVNVSQELRDAVSHDQRFKLRSLGNRRLRHIGDVRVYRLRPGPAWNPTAGSSARSGPSDDASPAEAPVSREPPTPAVR